MLRRIILIAKFWLFINGSLIELFCSFLKKINVKVFNFDDQNGYFYDLSEIIVKNDKSLFSFVFRFCSHCFIKYKKKKVYRKQTSPVYLKTLNHQVLLIYSGFIQKLQN